jgi:hypothetical protein
MDLLVQRFAAELKRFKQEAGLCRLERQMAESTQIHRPDHR